MDGGLRRDRFIVQVTLYVIGEGGGSCVSAGTIFLECSSITIQSRSHSHHLAKFPNIGSAVLGDGSSRLSQTADANACAWRVRLPNYPPLFVKPGLIKFRFLKRCGAGEEFIKQNAQ